MTDKEIESAIKRALSAISSGDYDGARYEYPCGTHGHLFVVKDGVEFKVFIDAGEFDYIDSIKGPGFSLDYDASEPYSELVDFKDWDYLSRMNR